MLIGCIDRAPSHLLMFCCGASQTHVICAPRRRPRPLDTNRALCQMSGGTVAVSLQRCARMKCLRRSWMVTRRACLVSMSFRASCRNRRDPPPDSAEIRHHSGSAPLASGFRRYGVTQVRVGLCLLCDVLSKALEPTGRSSECIDRLPSMAELYQQ